MGSKNCLNLSGYNSFRLFRVARLDFLGSIHFPTLSVYHVGINKDNSKRLPQLHCIKMKVRYFYVLAFNLYGELRFDIYSVLFRITFTAQCDMNLRMYPMDIQVCPLTIESCKYNPSLLITQDLSCFQSDLS